MNWLVLYVFFYLFEFDCFDWVDVVFFVGWEELNNDYKCLV